MRSNDFDMKAVEKILGKKLPITSKEFYDLERKYRAIAFTVANYNNVRIIEQFQEELVKAIAEGLPMSEFKKRMDKFLEERGYKGLTNFKADLIFRTNTHAAYNAGHYESMTSETVKKLRPYWQYVAVDDNHTRNSHRELNGRVYHCDDPVWDTIYPPNGFRCRCTVKTLSERQVRERGLKVEDKLPTKARVWEPALGMLTPHMEDFYIDPHFRGNAAKNFFAMDMSNLPPVLAAVLEKKLQTSKNQK